MKEIRETKLVEQTTVIFVANDDKVFEGANAERECADYERRKDQEKCKREFDKLLIANLDFPFIEACCPTDAQFVRLESCRDYQAVQDYYASLSHWMDFSDLEEPTAYPCTKLYICGEEWVYEHKGEINKIIDRLNTTANILKENQI